MQLGGISPGSSEVDVVRFGRVELTASAVALAGVVGGFGSRGSSGQRPAVVSDRVRAAVHSAAPAASPATADVGNLVATMPEAAFGPADAAPAVLVAGNVYPVVVTVWVAPGSGPAKVAVASTSGGLAGCAKRSVGPGITRLHCTFEPIGSSPSTRIDVSALLSDGTDISRTYVHRIG